MVVTPRKNRETLQLIVQRNIPATSLSPFAASGINNSASQPFLSSSYTDLSISGAARKTSVPMCSSQVVGVDRNGRRFSIPESGGLTQPADMSSYPHDESLQWLRSINSSRERMALSRDKLPEVPEETTSNSVEVKPPAVHFKQASTGTEHSRKSSMQSQTSQRSLTTQDYASSSAASGGMKFSFSQPSHLDASHSTTKTNGSRKLSLGSPEGDSGLYNLAMQSVASRAPGYCATQGSGHTYQPRSFYSSKVSTSSVESDSDSAYTTGHSSRSLNHDDGHSTSPHSFFLTRSKDSNQRSPTSLQFPAGALVNGHCHEEEFEDEGLETTVDWDVSVENISNCAFDIGLLFC